MASVYEKAGKWYMRVKDAGGRWRDKVTQARTKTEARRIADELERKAERQRLGLEKRLPEDGGGTLAELLRWWLDNYSINSPAHPSNVSQITRHLLPSTLATLPLTAVTAPRLRAFLKEKEQELSPQTLNHLRGFVSRAFNAAREVGRYNGPNPVVDVKKRTVTRRVGDFLRLEEVPRLFEALADRWRPLYATALYTGLRKGELLALRKTDVDLQSRLLTVSRSWQRDTTKGGHTDVIPIAADLVPFLDEAIRRSPSELVFPADDGSMMRRDVPLEDVLRRALGRAGIVTGYRHVCRRKGCGHSETAPDAAPRKCSTCSMSLWPKAQVRPVRFHDLRHYAEWWIMPTRWPPSLGIRLVRVGITRVHRGRSAGRRWAVAVCGVTRGCLGASEDTLLQPYVTGPPRDGRTPRLCHARQGRLALHLSRRDVIGRTRNRHNPPLGIMPLMRISA